MIGIFFIEPLSPIGTESSIDEPVQALPEFPQKPILE
jgi:hypothetical protein